MSEPSNRISCGLRDRTRVSVDQCREVKWWNKAFGLPLAQSSIQQGSPCL
jgi:hypothetical protein